MVRNINQQGGDKVSNDRFLPPQYPYFNAIVEEIVINEEKRPSTSKLVYKTDGSNIGEALVRVIPDDRGIQNKELKSAFPLEANIQQYPLPGEAVLVFKTFSGLYYTRPLNFTRKLAENTQNLIRRQFSPTVNGQAEEVRELASRGVTSETIVSDADYSLGKYFPDEGVLQTKSVRPNEGDVLIQGRFGHSIRVGSSFFEGPGNIFPNPNIILTAGFSEPEEASAIDPTTGELTPHALVYENINKDASSIWMVSNQLVEFTPSTALTELERKAHLLSAEDVTARYSGAQIFINSDRVILNSKLNEISLFSNNEINLCALQTISIDSERNIALRSFREITLIADDLIDIHAPRVSISCIQEFALKTKENYSISSKNIFIGRNKDTSEPMVLGGQLSLWLQKVLDLVLTPGFILTSTGPATINPAAMLILQQMRVGLGTQITPQIAPFNSRSNFTSGTNS